MIATRDIGAAAADILLKLDFVESSRASCSGS